VPRKTARGRDALKIKRERSLIAQERFCEEGSPKKKNVLLNEEGKPGGSMRGSRNKRHGGTEGTYGNGRASMPAQFSLVNNDKEVYGSMKRKVPSKIGVKGGGSHTGQS